MKTKKTINRYSAILKYISNSDVFKGIFLITIVIAFYGSNVITSGTEGLNVALLRPFSHNFFNLFLLMLFFILTFYTCFSFKKLTFYEIRFQDKKKYLLELLKVVLLVNFYYLLIFALVFTSFLLLNKGFDFKKNEYFYSIKIEHYAFFYLVRYIILLMMYSLILVFLQLLLKYKYIFLILIIMLFGFFEPPSFMSGLAINFQFFLWRYFQTISYPSFMIEVKYSLYFLLLVASFIIFLGFIYLKIYKRFNFKYIFRSDFSHLLQHKKHVLLMWIVVPIVVFIFASGQESVERIMKTSLGIGIGKEFDVLRITVYLFFLSISIFLIMELFLKDLKKNISLIFTRMKLEDWYITKLFSLLTITFLLKVVSYLILMGLIFSFKWLKADFYSTMLILFMTDYISTIAIQMVVLLIYMIFNVSNVFKFIAVLLTIVFIRLYSLLMINQSKYILNIAKITIVILLINYFVFKLKNRYILQNVGGV